jgi:Flp pilus assembly protein TadD
MTLAGVADALASLKRSDDALLVLERNVELFPGSPMPHNALAEFQAAQGKRDEAVRLFRKALAIDPKDGYAAMRLKTLESLESPAPK